jgi:hypothetical protein
MFSDLSRVGARMQSLAVLVVCTTSMLEGWEQSHALTARGFGVDGGAVTRIGIRGSVPIPGTEVVVMMINRGRRRKMTASFHMMSLKIEDRVEAYSGYRSLSWGVVREQGGPEKKVG